VIQIEKRGVVVAVLARESLPVWPSRPIWLAAGILRSTRMDTLVEKASELGVSVFLPLVLERSVARPAEEGTKQERWHRLAVESLKQSKRSHLMRVEDPRGLEDLLAALPPEATIWGADPRGEDPRGARFGPGPLLLLVGPEGGLSPGERARVEEKGIAWISLGGNRLRAETASLTLVAVALARLGEMAPGAAG
jgi:16S rRNA (uracil1498-N3)-methyltransferase